MKTQRRLFFVLMSALMVVALSIFAFACKSKKETTVLEINSKTEITLEIGEEYKLVYTCAGDVTVTVSGGGTFDSLTNIYTAETAGNWVLTVTGVENGKNPNSKDVSITVNSGADKAVLATAIAKADALEQSDYTTESWQAVAVARSTAVKMQGTHGETQELVNATAKELEDAIEALVPAAIIKATTAEGQITYKTYTYYADDYKNLAEVAEEVETLNEDTSIKLNSEYAAKLAVILEKLVANPLLTVTGAPNGMVLISELTSYKITANTDADKIVWTLNGEEVGNDIEYTYTPAAFGEEFVITVTATKGTGEDATTRTATYEGKIQKATYQTNVTGGITVENSVITVTDTAINWATQKGKKVEISDLVFSGDVTVYYDINFAEVAGDNSVLGIFFLNERGEDIDNWAVVNFGQRCIEVATEDGSVGEKKFRTTVSLNLNTTYHLKAERAIKEGKGYLTIWLLDDNGREIAKAESPLGKNYVGGVKIGIQVENVKGTVSNISVNKDVSIFDKTPLSNAIAECTAEYPESDYTKDSYKTYSEALSTAKNVLATATMESQITAAVTALREAYAGLKIAPVTPVDTTAEDIEFNNTIYDHAIYDNYAEVVAEIAAIDYADMTQSQYNAEVAKIIEKLEVKVPLKVTGSVTEGQHLVSVAPAAQTFVADVAEGTTVTWTVNGEKVTEGVSADGTTLTLTPALNVAYTVKADAEKGGEKAIPVEYKFSYIQVDYRVNNDKLEVNGDVITCKDATIQWGGNNTGEKLILGGKAFAGTVTVSFDIKFTSKSSDGEMNLILGVFLLDANGLRGNTNDYVVVNPVRKSAGDDKGNGILEVSAGNNRAEANKAMELNKTYTVKFTRTVTNGSATLNAWLYDEDGNLIATNANNRPTRSDTFTIGIQAENVTGTVSNFVVENGSTVYNLIALDAAIKTTQNNYKDSDYTGLAAYNKALDAAKAIYTDSEITQAKIDACTADLEKAYAEIKKIAVTPAVIDEENASYFKYNGSTYNKEDYTNFDEVLDKVSELNKSVTAETLVSEYDTAINAIIEELKLSLEVKVVGALEGTYVVNSLTEYTLTATSENVEAISWTVNGVEVTAESATDEETNVTTSKIKFTPAAYDTEYTIVVKATRTTNGTTKDAEKTFVSTFFKSDYTNKYATQISTDNNVVNVHENGIDWGTNAGQKVVYSDVNLHGEFVVTFDLKFTNDNNPIMALFLLGMGGGNDHNTYVVINRNSNFLGIGVGGNGDREPQFKYDESLRDSTLHVRVTREILGGRTYLKAELLDDNGKAIKLTKDGREYYSNEAYLKGEQPADNYNGGDRMEVVSGNVALGIQAENGQFQVSNLCVVSGTIIDRKVINEVLNTCLDFDKVNTPNAEVLGINFTNENEEIDNYLTARSDMWDHNCYSGDATPEEITKALEAYKTALAALKEAKIDVVKIDTTTNPASFTYGGNTYSSIEYKNYDEVVAAINEVNEDEYEYVTQYQAVIEPILATLEYALEVGITAVDADSKAVANNSVFLSSKDKTGEDENVVEVDKVFTLTALAAIGDKNSTENAAYFSFAWSLDGQAVAEATTATYTLAASEGTHVATVTATYTTDTGNKITISESFTLAFKTITLDKYNDVNVSTHHGTWNNTDKSYTLDESIGWSEWEGRNLEFDELVFNGSFSVQMDVTLDEKTGGANVVTIHLLNADTLSRNNRRDNANTAYGCICLQDNPALLETGGTIGKEQSNVGGTTGSYNTGDKFTVKLDVYRTANTKGQLSYDFSVMVNGEWVTFKREGAWNGDYSGGFIVGVNVENAHITLSNFKFELLDAGTRLGVDYVAGSVKSKADLYNAYVEYANVDASKYVNGDKFITAYKAAYAELCDNTVNADYVTAYNNLVKAYTDLVERVVFVDGLDSGYENYTGYDKFTAVLPDGATGAKWTYSFLAETEDAEAQEGLETEDGILTLNAGYYTDVVLSYTLDGKSYEIEYQDFMVNAVNFTNKNNVTVENNVVTVTENGGYEDYERLVLEDSQLDELEFSFDMKYTEGNVMCLRLFHNRSVEMVVRFTGNGGQIGFDNDGNDWGYVGTGGFEANKTYTFKVKVWKDVRKEDGKEEYHIIFSAYEKDGKLLASKEMEKTYSGDFDAQLRFAFENAHGELSNFKLMYN